MSKMVIRSFEEENKRRKTLRTVLFLISVPFLIIILLFAFKVLTITINANESVNTFEKKDYAASEVAASKQKENNFIQPWLAYYNSGTALTGGGKWADGIGELTSALDIAGDGIAQCKIRANLAIAYEGYGDEFKASENTVDADTQYAKALEIIAKAPSDCFPPASGASQAEEGQSMDQTDKRVKGKQSDDGSGDPATPTEGETAPTDQGETPEEKIQKQLDQSNDDRSTKESEERGSSSAPATPVDKPW